MTKICYSSEIYRLATADLQKIPDSQHQSNVFSKDEIILLIGKRRLWPEDIAIEQDTLLKGRAAVEKAYQSGEKYVPVRIAFESRVKPYDFLSPIIRKLRYKHTLFSSNIYHMKPDEIRKKGLERNLRTAENAYKFSNPKYKMSKQERINTYNKLRESMLKNGYDDRFPLDIMLCRNMGVQDTLNQGHHRISLAIECKLPEVAVEFCAAGQSPALLQPICWFIAKINMSTKHLLSRMRA